MYADTQVPPLMYTFEDGYSSSPAPSPLEMPAVHVDAWGYAPNPTLHDMLTTPGDSLFDPFIPLH